MEKINSRLDNSLNFETHYSRGLAKMKTRVGLALAVMMAMALGQVRAGRATRMRSLVGAVPAPRHWLSVCLTSDVAARPSRLPAEGKPRPPVSSYSRSVPNSRQIAAFCSPGRGQAVDIRPLKISGTSSKSATVAPLRKRTRLAWQRTARNVRFPSRVRVAANTPGTVEPNLS